MEKPDGCGYSMFLIMIGIVVGMAIGQCGTPKNTTDQETNIVKEKYELIKDYEEALGFDFPEYREAYMLRELLIDSANRKPYQIMDSVLNTNVNQLTYK